MEEIKNKKKEKGHAILIAIMFFITFSALFAFETNIGELGPIYEVSSEKVKMFIEKYYIYSGIVFSFLTVIIFFLLNIFTIFIKKYKIYFQYILLLIALIPSYLFSIQLVFYENRYAEYAKAIIYYIGYPLNSTIKDFTVLMIFFVILGKIILILKNIIKGKILRKKGS